MTQAVERLTSAIDNFLEKETDTREGPGILGMEEGME
jgi:hypothetical protein